MACADERWFTDYASNDSAWVRRLSASLRSHDWIRALDRAITSPSRTRRARPRSRRDPESTGREPAPWRAGVVRPHWSSGRIATSTRRTRSCRPPWTTTFHSCSRQHDGSSTEGIRTRTRAPELLLIRCAHHGDPWSSSDSIPTLTWNRGGTVNGEPDADDRTAGSQDRLQHTSARQRMRR